MPNASLPALTIREKVSGEGGDLQVGDSIEAIEVISSDMDWDSKARAVKKGSASEEFDLKVHVSRAVVRAGENIVFVSQ